MTGMLVITKAGKVMMKVIADSLGHNVNALVMYIRPLLVGGRVPSVYDVELRCAWSNFGGPRNLVIITETEICFSDGRDALVNENYPNPRYRNTFADPRFNPRCDRGTVENLIVIEINDVRQRPERLRITRTVERRKMTSCFTRRRSDSYSQILSCVLLEELRPLGEAHAMMLMSDRMEPSGVRIKVRDTGVIVENIRAGRESPSTVRRSLSLGTVMLVGRNGNNNTNVWDIVMIGLRPPEDCIELRLAEYYGWTVDQVRSMTGHQRRQFLDFIDNPVGEGGEL